MIHLTWENISAYLYKDKNNKDIVTVTHINILMSEKHALTVIHRQPHSHVTSTWHIALHTSDRRLHFKTRQL